jgi:hypothetical protein
LRTRLTTGLPLSPEIRCLGSMQRSIYGKQTSRLLVKALHIWAVAKGQISGHPRHDSSVRTLHYRHTEAEGQIPGHLHPDSSVRALPFGANHPMVMPQWSCPECAPPVVLCTRSSCRHIRLPFCRRIAQIAILAAHQPAGEGLESRSALWCTTERHEAVVSGRGVDPAWASRRSHRQTTRRPCC